MINLNNITMVAVACIRVNDTLNALKYSYKNIDFNSIKLLTHEDISDDYIEIIKIDKLDYENYNRFIVYELHKYIDTDFVLIIQDEGYIIDPTKWSDNFLKYDYIGAIWPIPPVTDQISYRDPFDNLIRVGNGGFSFRSKKILSLASQLNLEWKSYFGHYNEDGFICCHNRHIYEANGCVFAPPEVAKYFSHENEVPEIQGIQPFGFHRFDPRIL